jgi:hypothetical protein
MTKDKKVDNNLDELIKQLCSLIENNEFLKKARPPVSYETIGHQTVKGINGK